MIIGCNIWIICLELKCFFLFDPCRILKLSEFEWTLRSLVCVVFSLKTQQIKNKINSNHHRIFFDVSLYTLSFFFEHSHAIFLSSKLWNSSVLFWYFLCHSCLLENKLLFFNEKILSLTLIYFRYHDMLNESRDLN